MDTQRGATWSTSYPVNIDVEPQYDDRNRLTVLFRLILAIPHAILVGGPGASLAFIFFRGWGWGDSGPGWPWSWGMGEGILGAVAFIGAIIAWFAIIFANQHPKGLWDLANFYMRWRVRVVSYTALFRDEYPPFGDAAYPASFGCPPPAAERDKLSVGLRFFYAIPHFIILFFLGIAWAITSIIAWFAILFTGGYPRGMYEFGVGVFRWSMRVEAYMLLMRDEYPPFSMEP